MKCSSLSLCPSAITSHATGNDQQHETKEKKASTDEQLAYRTSKRTEATLTKDGDDVLRWRRGELVPRQLRAQPNEVAVRCKVRAIRVQESAGFSAGQERSKPGEAANPRTRAGSMADRENKPRQ